MHTPGPWEVDYGGTLGHIKSTAEREDYSTPTVCRYDLCAKTVADEAAANARLIAAAPDLLSACQDALATNRSDMQHCLDNGRLRDVLRSVIAKATAASPVATRE